VSTLVRGQTTGEAWAKALRAFPARELFGLVVDVEDPSETQIDAYAGRLDELLKRLGEQSIRTVANTIFPRALVESSPSRERLYERYLALHQVLRRAALNNSKGLYFERLIQYPLVKPVPERGHSAAQPDRTNQLETIITSLRDERTRGGLKHAFELQIFAPGLDVRPMGFPCMSSLSLQVDVQRLHLTATYRNQYYIQKALGNFVGLAGLQTWIASEAGLEVGRLTVHAYHAQIDPRVTLAQLTDLEERLPDPDEEG
jgi:hypothetical protein